jgi:hypothetical protein
MYHKEHLVMLLKLAAELHQMFEEMKVRPDNCNYN